MFLSEKSIRHEFSSWDADHGVIHVTLPDQWRPLSESPPALVIFLNPLPIGLSSYSMTLTFLECLIQDSSLPPKNYWLVLPTAHMFL